MLFVAFNFFLFFIIALYLNWVLKKKPILWKIFLLVSSYIFYSVWSTDFLFLLAIVTALNYAFGLLIERYKKPVLILSIVFNIFILGYFKYYDFFRVSFEGFLLNMGITPDTTFLRIIFPIGLSFYILRAISYIIDVYRKKIKAETSLLDFSIYISFFPHLLSGPIQRAGDFLPQLKEGGADKVYNFHKYGMLIVNGLFKKLIVSSFLTVELVDPVFAVPQNYSSFLVLMAGYAYAIVIYCDFSGYSDIAIGIAGFLGFESPKNFNYPYRAINIQDFWRRWHISLSTWFRDYLYIPLGGSKKGERRTLINIMIVMLVSGLWHGAAWTFVFWGFLHGIGMIFYRLYSYIRDELIEIEFITRGVMSKIASRVHLILSWFLTFNFITFAWIFFRAESITSAIEFIAQIFSFTGGISDLKYLYFTFIALFFFLLGSKFRDFCLEVQKRLPYPLQIALACIALVIILHFSSDVVPPFIYFSF